MADRLVVPWIVPAADALLRDWVVSRGELITLRPREILRPETMPYDSLYFVTRGAVGQAVVNDAIYTKPSPMNIFTAGRLMGFLNIFTGVPSPRRLPALLPAEVYAYPHRHARRDMEENPALFAAMARYSELCAKSELIGMELLFTLGPKERLEMLFLALLLSEGRMDAEGRVTAHDTGAPRRGMAELPYILTRDAMRSVVYLSRTAFDRLFAEWMKNGWFVRDGEGRAWVDCGRLHGMLDWVRKH